MNEWFAWRSLRNVMGCTFTHQKNTNTEFRSQQHLRPYSPTIRQCIAQHFLSPLPSFHRFFRLPSSTVSFMSFSPTCENRHIVVQVPTKLQAWLKGSWFSFRQQQQGLIQTPIQWVQDPFSVRAVRVKSRSTNLTIHLYLAPRFQNEWSFTSTPPTDLPGVQRDLILRLPLFKRTYI